jgi:hypothetical protein
MLVTTRSAHLVCAHAAPVRKYEKHLFCAPQGYLAEIGRLDVPVTSPKAKRVDGLNHDGIDPNMEVAGGSAALALRRPGSPVRPARCSLEQ